MSMGIYKITNRINGKVYIGQSVNIQQRWYQHKSSFKNGNTLLYQAIRKYGLENFCFEIIEECPQEKLNEKEIYWIDYYNSFNYENGYNMTPGGSEPISVNPKEIYNLWDQGYSVGQIYNNLKDKMSYGTIKNYLHSYSNWNNSESRRRSSLLVNRKINKENIFVIKQYDLFGNFIKNWNSAKEIERELGICSVAITYVLNGKQVQSGGFQWKEGLKDNRDAIESIIEKTPLHFGIIQKDLEGKIIAKYKTLKEASEAVKTDPRNISRVCKKEKNRKTAKGYIWEYDFNNWYDSDK